MDCVICQESCFEYGATHSLDCGHKFHASCIVSWFRSGNTSCPVCRDEPQRILSGSNSFLYIKRLSKLKSCPTFIKDALNDYEQIKSDIKQLTHELQLFETNAEGRYNVIKRQIYNKKKNLKRKKRLLNHAKNRISNSNVFIVPITKYQFD